MDRRQRMFTQKIAQQSFEAGLKAGSDARKKKNERKSRCELPFSVFKTTVSISWTIAGYITVHLPGKSKSDLLLKNGTRAMLSWILTNRFVTFLTITYVRISNFPINEIKNFLKTYGSDTLSRVKLHTDMFTVQEVANAMGNVLSGGDKLFRDASTYVLGKYFNSYITLDPDPPFVDDIEDSDEDPSTAMVSIEQAREFSKQHSIVIYDRIMEIFTPTHMYRSIGTVLTTDHRDIDSKILNTIGDITTDYTDNFVKFVNSGDSPLINAQDQRALNMDTHLLSSKIEMSLHNWRCQNDLRMRGLLRTNYLGIGNFKAKPWAESSPIQSLTPVYRLFDHYVWMRPSLEPRIVTSYDLDWSSSYDCVDNSAIEIGLVNDVTIIFLLALLCRLWSAARGKSRFEEEHSQDLSELADSFVQFTTPDGYMSMVRSHLDNELIVQQHCATLISSELRGEYQRPVYIDGYGYGDGGDGDGDGDGGGGGGGGGDGDGGDGDGDGGDGDGDGDGGDGDGGEEALFRELGIK